MFVNLTFSKVFETLFVGRCLQCTRVKIMGGGGMTHQYFISFLSAPKGLTTYPSPSRTEEESSMSMSPSVIKVCHMCGFSGVKGYVGVRGAGNGMGIVGIVGMRQLILSIGLVWMGVCICAHRATTPTTVKRFLLTQNFTYLNKNPDILSHKN